MRLARRAIFVAIGLTLIAIYLLRLTGEHIGADQESAYRFAEGLGLFFLFLAGVLFLATYGFLALKLSHGRCLLLGCVTLVLAAILWMLAMQFGVSVHSWTITLLFPSMFLFVAGSIPTIGGAIRFLISTLRSEKN